VDVAGPQGQHDELVVIGTGDDQRQVLVLVIVTVPEGQLLLAVGRVIDRVQVEGHVTRRGVDGGEELVEDDVAQALVPCQVVFDGYRTNNSFRSILRKELWFW
jgi:hypothetical protein